MQVDDNGSHTISAITSMSDSTVVTNNSNAGTGLTLSGNLRQANSGTLTFTGSGTTLVSGNITDFGQHRFLKTGSGTLTLSNAANAYTGTTTVRNGTVVVNANAPSGVNGALGNSATAVVVDDASTTGTMNTSLLIGTGGVSISRAVTVGSQGGTTTLGGSNTTGTSTFAGAITFEPRRLADRCHRRHHDLYRPTHRRHRHAEHHEGRHRHRDSLQCRQQLQRHDAVNAGTLRVGVAGALPNRPPHRRREARSMSTASSRPSVLLAGAGSVTLGTPGGATTFSTGGDNTSTTFSGVLSGGANAAVTKAGTGAMTLSGSNTYGGVTNVTNGTLIAASNNALGNTGANTNTIVSDGATLGFSGGVTISNEPSRSTAPATAVKARFIIFPATTSSTA